MVSDGTLEIEVDIDDSDLDRRLDRTKRKVERNMRSIEDSAEIEPSLDDGKLQAGLKSTSRSVSDTFQKAKKEASVRPKIDPTAEREFKSALQRMEERNAKTFRNIKRAAVVGIGAIGVAVAKLGTTGVQYNALMEGYQTSFKVMLGSAEKAAEVVERLKTVASRTPFELTDLADTTQLLINYGQTADEAIDKMMMLGDISQGNAEKLTSVATAYGQMTSAGKVQLQDIKQMINAGFNPLQEIVESTGESMASLYDRISRGTISVDEITEAMVRSTSEGGKYFKSMEAQSETFNGRVSTLKDTINNKLGAATKDFSNYLTSDLIPNLIKAVDSFDVDKLKSDVVAFAGVVKKATPIVLSFFAAYKLYPYIDLTSKALRASGGVVGASTRLWGLFNKVLLANPWIALGAGIAAVTLALTMHSKATRKADEDNRILGQSINQRADEMNALTKAYEAQKEAADELLTSALVEVVNAERLAKELDRLVDSNGQLIEGNEERASFILNELNQALGTEYDMTDLLEGKYRDLKASIDEMVLSKQADVILESKKEEYANALANEGAAAKQLGDDLNALNSIKKEQEDLNADIAAKESALMERFGDGWKYMEEAWRSLEGRELSGLYTQIGDINSALDTQEQTVEQSRNQWQQYTDDIAKYAEASTAVLQGDPAKVAEIYDSYNETYKRAEDLAGKSSEEQQRILKDQYDGALAFLDDYKKNYLAGVKGYTEEGLAAAEEYAAKARTEYERVGVNMVDGVMAGISLKRDSLLAQIRQLGADVTAAYNAELQIRSPSRVFAKSGVNMVEGIQVGVKQQGERLVSDVLALAGKVAAIQFNAPQPANSISNSISNSVVNNTRNVTQQFYSEGLLTPFTAFRRVIEGGGK